jgi:V/A-type H+-transporting ATPase subunit K
MEGKAIGAIGIALCMILCGVGSAFGLYKTGAASAGVLAEDGKKFSKIIVLSLLPATQGIYGFVLAVMKISALAEISVTGGWALFGATVAMGFSGLASGALQGKAAAACICAVGKNSAGSGKYVLFPAMIEFYAILALVLGIMLK